jgi:hypothetical protein
MKREKPRVPVLIAVNILPSKHIVVVIHACKNVESIRMEDLPEVCVQNAENLVKKVIGLVNHAVLEMLLVRTSFEKTDVQHCCVFFVVKSRSPHHTLSANHAVSKSANEKAIIVLMEVTEKPLSSAIIASASSATAHIVFAYITKTEQATQITPIMTMTT